MQIFLSALPGGKRAWLFIVFNRGVEGQKYTLLTLSFHYWLTARPVWINGVRGLEQLPITSLRVSTL